MSAHNVMASIGRTLGTRHFESKPINEVKLAGQETKEKGYGQKQQSKLVRALTVVAYIVSVSLAAIVLSLYYMYIWVPSDYLQYKRANYTTTRTAPGTARTPCVDVTPALAATSTDASTLAEGPSTESTTPLDGTSERDLLKTLTTPRPDAEADYPSSTDLPAMPSISSEQFQAMPPGEYHDGTIEPAEDLMDE